MRHIKRRLNIKIKACISLACFAAAFMSPCSYATPIFKDPISNKPLKNSTIKKGKNKASKVVFSPEIPVLENTHNKPAINNKTPYKIHKTKKTPQKKIALALGRSKKPEISSVYSILNEEPPKKYTGISKAPFVGPPTLSQFKALKIDDKSNIQLAMIDKKLSENLPQYTQNEKIGFFNSDIDHFSSFDPAKAKGRWILVDTQKETISVMQDDKPTLILHEISIGRNGITTDKTINDEQTPLGKFRINRIKHNSQFKLFFGINYPTRSYAKQAFLNNKINNRTYNSIIRALDNNKTPPQLTDLGGYLGIHGLGKADPDIHKRFNWTKGCVAVTNKQIMKLRKYIKLGTIVVIK